MFSHLSIGTNIAMGYSFEEALKLLKAAGFQRVEISSIAGMCEHADPRLMDEAYARAFSALLRENGMTCSALAGHVDLTEPLQLEHFLKKIAFAARIGAPIVNTNCGPAARMDDFRRNIRRVIAQAERYGVMVCLESHGDIVNTARQSVKIFREINHPLIRFNYDTGNTYFYQKGRISIAEDIRYGFEYLEHVHLKDIRIQGGRVQYTPLGQGDLDFPAICAALRELGRDIPIGIEIPVFVSGDVQSIGPVNYPLPPQALLAACGISMDYLRGIVPHCH